MQVSMVSKFKPKGPSGTFHTVYLLRTLCDLLNIMLIRMILNYIMNINFVLIKIYNNLGHGSSNLACVWNSVDDNIT
jgi:hypothetical protein